jgi:hypothetical protein
MSREVKRMGKERGPDLPVILRQTGAIMNEW